MGESTTDVTTGITELEATRTNQVERRTGDDAHLTSGRDCIGKFPSGNRDAHTALNYRGQPLFWLRIRHDPRLYLTSLFHLIA